MILWIVLRLCDLYCGEVVPQGLAALSWKTERRHNRIWWSVKSTWRSGDTVGGGKATGTEWGQELQLPNNIWDRRCSLF